MMSARRLHDDETHWRSWMRSMGLAWLSLVVGCSGGDGDGSGETGLGGPSWGEAFDVGGVTALSGVWGSGPDDVYMVGGDATTGAIWHYDGTSWAVDTSAPATDLLVWVFGFGPDDVWIVGEGGAILHGSVGSWTQLDAGTTEPLWGVWGASPGDVWIVGGDADGDEPTLLHHDGTQLTAHALDPAQNDRNARALFKVWGIGGRIFAVGQDGLIIEYDGAQWVQMPAGAEANDDFVALWGTAIDNIVAVGGRASARLSTFDGSAWTTTSPTQVPGLNAVTLAGPDEAVIGGANGWVGRFDPSTSEIVAEEVVDPASDVHALWYDGQGTTYGVSGHFTEPYFGTALIRTEL